MKRALAEKHARLYTIDAIRIAREIGLRNRTNTILQASFFKLAEVIPLEQAVEEMKTPTTSPTLRKKGQEIVDMNNNAIDYGINELKEIQIPDSWAAAEDAPDKRDVPEFITEVVDVMNRQQGDVLKVSQMTKYGLEDGTWPSGTTKYEKRGAAVDVPEWDAAKCIQCNQCVLESALTPPSVRFWLPKKRRRRRRLDLRRYRPKEKVLRNMNTVCRYPLTTVPDAEAA